MKEQATNSKAFCFTAIKIKYQQQ